MLSKARAWRNAGSVVVIIIIIMEHSIGDSCPPKDRYEYRAFVLWMPQSRARTDVCHERAPKAIPNLKTRKITEFRTTWRLITVPMDLLAAPAVCK